jgi:hypothetical protein
MWDDPIVAEVRRVREEYAARFNYDLDAIFRDIKEREKRSGRTFVSFPPRRVSPAEQEAARLRLQKMLEEEGQSSDPTGKPESPDSRRAG